MLSLGLLAPSASLLATDYYMTLSGGASPQTGASWNNAFSYANRTTVLNTTLQPGDTLFLEGNHYVGQTLSINSSGTSTARKRLIGVDHGIVVGGVAYTRPVIEGTSTSENNGAAITLQSGTSFWTLQNLEGRRSGWAMRTLGNNDGLIIDNVTNYSNASVSSYNTVHGLGFNDADNLQIINCNVARHVKYGIHLIQGCDNVTIWNCHADGTGKGDTPDTYASYAGFMLHTDAASTPMNTNVTLEDCSSRNHNVPSANQGDGFLVEYNNTGVNFIRCISFDNLQAGFDAKGLNQTFTDCVSIRVGNGYKIWKNATMYNCIAAETRGNVLFLPQLFTGDEHVVTAYNCTFHVSPTNTSGGACVFIERGPAGYIRATLYNCLLTRANASNSYSKNIITGGYSGLSGSVDLRTGTADETKQHNSAAILTNAPQYTSLTTPWKPWDLDLYLTADTAYDSVTYGATKGYHSSLLAFVTAVDATADAYVYNSNPNTNYGTTPELYVKDAPNGNLQDRISYFKFPVSGLGTITSAKLILTCTSVDAGTPTPTVEVRQVTNDSWTETGVTYNTRPAETGTLISSFTAAPGVWEFDVTSFVTAEAAGDGTVTFALKQPPSLTRGVHFAARENASVQSRPVLEVE